MSEFIVTDAANLPPIDEIRTGDEVIVLTDSGPYRIDFENFVIPLQNTTFESTVSANTTNIAAISSQHDTDLQALSSDLVDRLENLEVLTLYYLAKPGITFKAQGSVVQVPFNFTHVSNISSDSVDSSNISPDACNVTMSTQTSSFTIPKGTYKVSAHASMIAKSNSASDSPIWAYFDIFQKTPPTNAHITSNIATTDAVSGSLTMFADGYMWLCRDAEVALRITTVDTALLETFHAGTSGFPIQLALERVSRTNALNPLKMGITT
tara:strand:+ start:15477 stop:16274 length:798 start_codon:yes stop_codon:yes gene_type:complete